LFYNNEIKEEFDEEVNINILSEVNKKFFDFLIFLGQ